MRGRKYCTVRVLYIHMSILSWITGSWSEHICITGQMTGSGCTLYCIKTRIQYPRKITILPHSFISYYFFREIFFLFLQHHCFCIIFFTILFSQCFFQVTYFVLPLGTFYLYCVATSFSFVMLLSYLAMIDWFSLYILNLCADIGALHNYKCFCI